MILSIMGMYEFDNTLFDGLTAPSYTDEDNNTYTVNKQVLINNILLKCAELEIIYTKFDTMKTAIEVWSEANKNAWNKLYKTELIKYEPLWNVDANVTIERERSGENENINSVQGFNTSTWSNANKDNGTFGDDETVTERRTGNIGVTASQDLIKKEREIADFNIIDFITDSFKKRFCLMVY